MRPFNYLMFNTNLAKYIVPCEDYCNWNIKAYLLTLSSTSFACVDLVCWDISVLIIYIIISTQNASVPMSHHICLCQTYEIPNRRCKLKVFIPFTHLDNCNMYGFYSFLVW
jgi:hypothetical protein